MEYIFTTGWEDGVASLTERLARELKAGKKVLWLVSGGSNIQASVQIMGNIASPLSRNLTISLVDERFGPVNHADSNWQQLMSAGFAAKNARLLPVLQAGLDLSATRTQYDQSIRQAMADSDIVIAQIGIGEDGHLAGILPGSPAAQDDNFIAAYHTPKFDRLTLTFSGLSQIDVAYVFAFGDNKHQALTALQNQSLALADQPAQILKQLPEVYLYSDQAGNPHQ